MSDVRVSAELGAEESEAVLALAGTARDHDGVAPLSEQTVLRVHNPAPGAARFHLLHEEDASGRRSLSGFGYAERSPGEPDSGELVVAPARRRRGNGTTLLRSLSDDASTDGLRVWAHGRLDAAVALASSVGWRQVRGLLKMRLPLRGGDTPDLPAPAPSGAVRGRLTIRPFRVGADEEAWLRANAAAFADHPEQGRITLDDLRQRENEAGFDPAGFFVAEEPDTGRIAGFHWTKLHPDGAGLTDGEAVGEVYVLGVDPAWQGTGLGRVLAVVGLRHLRDLGLPWVLLYVDEENHAAVRLYGTLGFSVWDADVMYAAPTT